jgi:hypothetical protein
VPNGGSSLRFTDCRKCVEHFKELSARYGIGAPLAFAAVALEQGTDPETVFRGYMHVHHKLGHPDDSESEFIVSAVNPLRNQPGSRA